MARMTQDASTPHGFSWQAIQERLGNARMLIRVSGHCERPRRLVEASLRRAERQPGNPHILLLIFTAERLDETVDGSAPSIAVEYQETSDRPYKLVSIEPGGIGIAVQTMGE
jgi:hypothetical protein